MTQYLVQCTCWLHSRFCSFTNKGKDYNFQVNVCGKTPFVLIVSLENRPDLEGSISKTVREVKNIIKKMFVGIMDIQSIRLDVVNVHDVLVCLFYVT